MIHTYKDIGKDQIFSHMALIDLFQKLITPSPDENDIVLTGLPRSGTTLATKILSDQENVIALNEPIQWKSKKTGGIKNRESAVKLTKASYASFRRSLLNNGTAVARVKDGKLTDNHYERTEGKRRKVINREVVSFDKPLSKDFKLILKHNSVFTLLLSELNAIYEYYAIIRNPLAVLGSWNSVNVPVSRGVMRHLEVLDPDLLTRLNSVQDVLAKQLIIMDYYFSQYSQLKEEQIIRYEDVIAKEGAILSGITKQNIVYNASLENKNVSVIYNPADMIAMGEQLLASDGAYWSFYSKSDVESVMDDYKALERHE